MFDYKGYECKVCGEKFGQDDDIVVCPECGTPYHRECYKKEGKCINTELHDKKMSWKEANVTEDDLPVRCRNCGNNLRADQLFCDRCGVPSDFCLKNNGFSATPGETDSVNNADGSRMGMETMYPYMINYSDPLCGFNPEEQYEENVNLKDLGDYVKTNTKYYLPKFRMIKTANFKFGFNIAAFFFPEFYFAFRKMPLIALLIMIVRMIVGLPETGVALQITFKDEFTRTMFMHSVPEAEKILQALESVDFTAGSWEFFYNASGFVDLIIRIGLAFFATYIYYRNILKRVPAIKQEATMLRRSHSELLREKGGVSGGTLGLFFALYFLLQYFAIAAVFMLVL